MTPLELILVLLGAAAALELLARRAGIPHPVLLVLGGLGDKSFKRGGRGKEWARKAKSCAPEEEPAVGTDAGGRKTGKTGACMRDGDALSQRTSVRRLIHILVGRCRASSRTCPGRSRSSSRSS